MRPTSSVQSTITTTKGGGEETAEHGHRVDVFKMREEVLFPGNTKKAGRKNDTFLTTMWTRESTRR